MNCGYCGYYNEEPTDECGRCGAELPDPTCQQCGTDVDWGTTLCEQCRHMSQSADKTPCPSCGDLNNVSAEYCTTCGTPMAVVTQITELPNKQDRQPLETWRVYGVETEMVGRGDEMDRLEQWLTRTIEESALRLVAVTGETGLGKSRLFAEFKQRVENRFDETVVIEAASRDDSAGPYGMFARLFKNRYYIAENENPETARRKFTDAVRSIVGEERVDRIAPRVGHHIGIPFDDSPHVPDGIDETDGADLDSAGLEAMVELLRADAQQNPIVVALEDLQYAKAQSLQLLEHLCDQLADVPILFLVSWNAEEVFQPHLLDSLQVDDEIELRPLPDQQVQQFVRQTLHKAGQVPRSLIDRIVDAAHGNPLSVEEMLRILISDGVIDTRQTDWTFHLDRVDDVELPTTVEETVRKRLAALSDDERSVLEMASCVGNTFWTGTLRALFHLRADHDGDVRDFWFDEEIDERLDELLESLERKDMVRRRDESRLRGHEEYYFKHQIERRSIYGEIPGQTKQRYHRLVAQWLDRTVEEGGDRIAEQIAEHYDKGHCLDRAAKKYIRAGEYAAARFANQKAVDLFTKGLGYLSDADMDLKLSAFHDLGTVYDRRGEYDQSLAYFREMLRYAWLLDDTSKAGASLNKIGRAYRGLGEYDEALENLERALDLFWVESDLRGVASTLDDIGKIYWIRGQYDEALKYYSAGLELRRETAHDRSIALSLSNLGSLKLQRGELNEAMSYYREALEIRQSIEDRQGVADSYNTLGALCLEREDTEDAITLFEEALEIARDIGHRIKTAQYLNNLGEAYLTAERFEEAGDCLEEARDEAERSGDKRILFDVLRNLGRAARNREAYELADERIDEALALADELDSPALLGVAMQTRADVYGAWCRADDFDDSDRADETEGHYRDAIDLLREVGNQAKLGRCFRRFGKFLLDRGDEVRGRQNLERAREIFERLEIRKLREATEQAIHQI